MSTPRLLVLVRHAKSSWGDALLADHERPLNDRGRRDAPIMAQRLMEALAPIMHTVPNLWLVSTAVRTQRTWQLMASAWPTSTHKQNEPSLYNASVQDMLAVIAAVPEGHSSLGLIAHNPGTSLLLAHLTGDPHLGEVPTCAVAAVLCHAPSWAALTPGTAELLYYGYPKDVA